METSTDPLPVVVLPIEIVNIQLTKLECVNFEKKIPMYCKKMQLHDVVFWPRVYIRVCFANLQRKHFDILRS